jgi:hypothetical protein
MSKNKTNYNNMSNLNELLQLSGKKPKVYNKKGEFSKAFIDWNKRQIREGKTDKFIIPTQFYNESTGRFIKGQFNKKGTKLLKSFTNKYPNISGNVINTAKVDNVYTPSNFDSEGTYNGVPIMYKNYLFELLKKFKTNSLVRIILTTTSDINIDDETFLIKKYKKKGINLSKNIIINETAFVPNSIGEYESLQYLLYYNSDYENIIGYLLENGISCRLVITEQIQITEKQIVQKFAQGETNCLLTPILEWAQSQVDNKDTKQKNIYQSIVNKINGKSLKSGIVKQGYFQQYIYGVPESEISDLVEDLGISIVVEYPFRTIKHKSWTCSKKPRKKFVYTNTRYNHVEHITTMSYDDLENDSMTQTEIDEQFNTLKDNQIYFIFGRTRYGISWIQTYDKIYRRESGYNNIVNDFCRDNNFDHFKIDAIKQKDLTKFINNGTHFNCTVDFVDIDNKVLENDKSIRHIDIIKAYSQFQECSYYDGFVGSITDFREVDNFTQQGLYYIDGLDLSVCNSTFVFYNTKMNWFVDKNIYTKAELHFLKDMGASFNVRYGAYGIKTDFKFNDEMLFNKEPIKLVKQPKRWNGNTHKYDDEKIIELKIPYYAKFIGQCAMINYDRRIQMLGEYEYFTAMKDDGNKIYYDHDLQEATIHYRREHVFHHKHITSQVLAYQRLNIIEQLMKMDSTKILRVCVDGIYYREHTFETDNIFQDKTSEMTLRNLPCTDYLSNIFKDDDSSISNIKLGKKRDFYKTEAIIGGGGNGKSTCEFIDIGHVRCLYLAPSWKLATNVSETLKSNNYNQDIDVSVYNRFLNLDHEYKLQSSYNVILCDEASQLTEYVKRKLCNIPNKKIIFLGDLGYQLEPVITDHELVLKYYKNNPKNLSYADWKIAEGHYEMKLDDLDNVKEYTTDYRATCPKLRSIKKELRRIIDFGRKEKFNSTQMSLSYIKKMIPERDVREHYLQKDMILTSTHESIKKYNEQFSYIPKYLVKANTKYFKNGQIVYTKPNTKIATYKNSNTDTTHAFTIHAIQGETLGHDDKLYIDIENMFSERMIYTAVSRARRLDQIYLIKKF